MTACTLSLLQHLLGVAVVLLQTDSYFWVTSFNPRRRSWVWILPALWIWFIHNYHICQPPSYPSPPTNMLSLCSHRTRKVQDLWWQGLPPGVRGEVWKRAIGNDLNISPGKVWLRHSIGTWVFSYVTIVSYLCCRSVPHLSESVQREVSFGRAKSKKWSVTGIVTSCVDMTYSMWLHGCHVTTCDLLDNCTSVCFPLLY